LKQSCISYYTPATRWWWTTWLLHLVLLTHRFGLIWFWIIRLRFLREHQQLCRVQIVKAMLCQRLEIVDFHTTLLFYFLEDWIEVIPLPLGHVFVHFLILDIVLDKKLNLRAIEILVVIHEFWALNNQLCDILRSGQVWNRDVFLKSPTDDFGDG